MKKKPLSLLLIIAVIMTFTSNAAFAITAQQGADWAVAQIGKSIDTDGQYGAQCVDLIVQYCNTNFGWNPQGTGNAEAYRTVKLPNSSWQRIQNTPDFIPQPGDIAIWNPASSNGYCGHVAIVISANINSFVSVDQNWYNSNSTKGSPAAKVTHNYTNFWGVIRPPFSAAATSLPAVPAISSLSASSSGISVSWNAVAQAEKYVIDFWKTDGSHNYFTTTATSMTQELPHGYYGVRISAENSLGSSGWSGFHYTYVLPVLAISFDANGGEIERQKARIGYDDLNTERGTNQLVIYTNSGTTTGTNAYGTEAIVDSSAKVINIINSVGNATVPTNGLIVSGHREKGYWINDNISIGDYVNYHGNIKEVWVFTENGWLSNTKKVLYDQEYGKLPSPLQREGYSFIGWFTEPNGGTKITSNTKVTITEPTTLYAHWEKLDYTISYNLNGGIGEIADCTYSADVDGIITDTLPLRSGYKFLGWGKSPSSSAPDFLPGQAYKDHTDITLYAVWKTIPHTETTLVSRPAYSLFTVNVLNQDTDCIIALALYNGGTLTDLQLEPYSGNPIDFASFANFDTAKVLLWSNINAMHPLSAAETVK